ncbi:hypothetical protein LC040_05950 [Bacillus tianshenii]|nr:hypothetical protein LC040_05950 [Bacillus tianshenii]
MVYEVKFCRHKKEDDFHTVHIAIVAADNVTDCREQAEEIVQEKGFNENYRFFIEDWAI